MCRKKKVIEAHRGLGCVGVSICILGAYRGRVEERSRRDGVAGEAEDVERGEIDG